MNGLDLLITTGLIALPFHLLLANRVRGRMLLSGLFVLQLGMLIGIDPGGTHSSVWQHAVLGNILHWQLDATGWYFAIITLGAAALSALYAVGQWGETFRAGGRSLRWLFAGLQLNVSAMLLLLSSADLLSFFITWELVSWAGLVLMVLGGNDATEAAKRYVYYVVAGGMAFLGAIALAWSQVGTLQAADIAAAVPDMPGAYQWALALLLFTGFGIKMGVLPFHLWQAPAYALSPGPAGAFLGAISSRMGLFAMAAVPVKLFGIGLLDELAFWPNVFDLRDLLMWVAALTVILPTFTALRQNDARRLLAWHGIGQGGYMLLGLLAADAMGTAGGLMHVFNHATYQAALFMSVFAIIHRTGTADLNSLGGLVTRMPLTFLTMLVGIIGLAGLPPMNGFVSKWLVYRSLVDGGMPLLFVAAVIGTLGTILSVYKLLHNSFLGQLRIEHEHVHEVPWSMMLPMLILSALVLVTGMMPGLVLEYVALAQAALGLPVVDYTLGGVKAASGSLDMLWISGVLFAGFGIGAVLFYGVGGKARRVHQLDNYAGGHFLTADTRYQYSDNFYAGLMNRIKPWYRGSFQWGESALVSAVGAISLLVRGFFRQDRPEFWMLAGVTLIGFWVMRHVLA